MPIEKTASTEKSAPSTASQSFAMADWWKPQTAAVQSLYGEVLTLFEARLRKQADLLHELASAKDIPDTLKAQTRFVQDIWDNSTQDALKMFSALRRTGSGGA